MKTRVHAIEAQLGAIKPLLVALLACAVVLSCAPQSSRVLASPSDYADYRRTRVNATLPERIQAAVHYLSAHPQGAFRAPVEAWLAQVEPVFFEVHADSLAGMEKYLATWPAGPHAETAAQRRDAFAAQARIDRGETIAARGADFERRLAAAAQARDEVIAAYAAWIGHALDFDAFGRAPSDAKGAFSTAWLADPAPRCTKERCTKTLLLPYELQIGGKPEKFVCLLEVSLGLVKGRVNDIVIAGPRLFVRIVEAHEARPIADDDAGRARALRFIVELTQGAAERVLPRARCDQEASSRAAMTRACDGRKLELFAAAIPDETEDRVVIHGRGEL